MMFDFEYDEVEDRERSFGEILLEASEMFLGDDEQIDHKDHGNTGACLIYFGGESMHLVELLHPAEYA